MEKKYYNSPELEIVEFDDEIVTMGSGTDIPGDEEDENEE